MLEFNGLVWISVLKVGVSSEIYRMDAFYIRNIIVHLLLGPAWNTCKTDVENWRKKKRKGWNIVCKSMFDICFCKWKTFVIFWQKKYIHCILMLFLYFYTDPKHVSVCFKTYENIWYNVALV